MLNLLNKKKYSIFTDISRNFSAYMLAIPAIIYSFLFGYLTYPYMIVAFQQFDYRKGIFQSKWVGFKNFQFFFESNYAVTITLNTLKLNILFIMCVTIFAVVLALTLNELRNRAFLKLTQSIMLFPNYLSWVAVSFMLYGIFSFDKGFLNQVLKSLGIDAVNWYSTADPWTTILTVMKIWKDAGMSAVIFLAAISGIDGSIYEAASIDGANRWQQCKAVTIPLLMPTVAILTLLSMGKIMYGDFGMIYALVGDNGVLFPSTDVIDTYVFRSLRKIGDPSGAMAIGLFQSTIGFIMVYGCNWLTKRFFKEGALY
jgi:putative aldouronate transport system permease protein